MGLRINNNLASLGAALNLGRANAALSSSLAKLSTGLKINTASDGPADLIISEKFRSQITAISKATENTQNAISMLSTAEGALAEVNSLLNKMQGLALKATQTGTQSPDEIAASQAEIDAALASINSISRNTSFGSVNLLDGSQAIETTGVDTSKILVDIEEANFLGATKELEVDVKTVAQRASVDIAVGAATLAQSQVLKVTGNRGSSTITFAQGAAIGDMRTEINAQVNQTGVIATVSGTTLTLKSAKYGSSEFVTVEDVDGTNDILKDTSAGSINLGNTLFETTSVPTAISSVTFYTSTSEFNEYTFELQIGTPAAPSALIDTSNKKVTITAAVGESNTNVFGAINTAITNANILSPGTFTASQFASNNGAGVINAGASGTYSFSVAAGGAPLQIKVNSGVTTPTNGFTVTIASGAADSIAYDEPAAVASKGEITLTLSADLTTAASLTALIASSAQAAQLNSLFTFTLSGTIDETNDRVTDSEFGSTSSTVSNQANTNYVTGSGVDGVLEVNGVKTAADNLTFTFDNGNIRGRITVDETFITDTTSTETFTLTSKGAFLQIGSKAQLSHQVGVGIKSVAVDQLATGLYINPSVNQSSTTIDQDSTLYTTATLGDIKAGGEFDLASNAQTAYDIIQTAIEEVAVQRAKLGAFISNTLESNINSLGVSFENLTAAESRIRDVDFASETAEFTRAQILVQAGTSVAAQANVATQAALQLLG